MVRSGATTVVGSLSLLLVLLAVGSLPPATLAVVVKLGEAASAPETVSVIAGALLPAVIVFAAGRTQVTVCAAAEQAFQPVPVLETKVRPEGRTSVTVTLALVAVEPSLVTTSE